MLRLQMRMHVHQTGHDSVLSQVEQCVARFGFNVAASDAGDFTLVNDDGDLHQWLVAVSIDHSSCMNDGRAVSDRCPRKN